MLLIATSNANATANHGNSGGWETSPAVALSPSTAPRRVNSTANTITGSSIATRTNLTTVAASPVSCDMP